MSRFPTYPRDKYIALFGAHARTVIHFVWQDDMHAIAMVIIAYSYYFNLRTRFSTKCPQLATKCIELVGGRKVVGGHQLSSNVASSDQIWMFIVTQGSG
jgi:hypothetical protein